ncbi:MAG TPA: glycosyltransferase family 2 protein [Gemmatimonadales bacterium]|nr:glycosyltransferase family 2 protein [Gemmatimonadales bacterium]
MTVAADSAHRRQPRENPRLLSLVIPAFNEEDVLPMLRPRLEALLESLPCPGELIFVDDGSRDRTALLLRAWAGQDRRVKVLELSRNFGHQAAVTAGTDHAAGDAVVIMDADLQDPPELVHRMLERYREGYDVVYAQRARREGETALKRATAALFYWIMRRFVHRELPAATGDFRLMSRDVAEALRHLREGQRFIRGMVTWLGYTQTAVVFDRPSRAAGTTKYPLRKMLSFAWDAILSFSSAPLRATVYLGFGTVLFGLVVAGYSVFRWTQGVTVAGWTTIIVLQSFVGGITLIGLGMVGEYIGRIYEESKQRPIYIIRRATNARGLRPATRSVTPRDGLERAPEEPES